MNWLRQFAFRLQAIFHKGRIEAELSEEIRTHLEMATEANILAGMPPEEARAAALRQFGGVDQVQESYRDVRGFPWIEQLIQDLGYAARSLCKNPGFAATAILTLALGIGVNTTTFSFVNAVALRPLPFERPKGVVLIYHTSLEGGGMGPHSPGDILDVKAQNEVFARFSIIDFPDYSISSPGQPAERVRAFAVDGDFFAMMGVPPLLGRVFGAAEAKPGHNEVVVLSYRFWRQRFAGDPAIVGRSLRLDGEDVQVVGVMPEQFDTSMVWGSQDIWRPLVLSPDVVKGRDGRWLQAFAQLKPGSTIANAQTNLNAIAVRLGREYPLTDAQSGFRLTPIGEVSVESFAWIVIGLAAAVLLIACANLANLQLARNSGRAREYAIRIALGASRFRLLRQLLTESLALAMVSGAVGVLVAVGTNRILGRQIALLWENEVPPRLSIDVRVLGFALFAALAAGAFFGIAPAWFASRVDPNAGLKQSGRGMTGDRSRHRLRHALVVIELSLTLVLLSGSGYFMRGFSKAMQRDYGWRTDHLLSGRFALPGNKYGGVEKCSAFYSRLNEELASVPGVERSVTCDILPLGGFYNSRPVVEEGTTVASGQAPVADSNTTTPGYFDVLGVKILQGRDFTALDRSGSPAVIVINQTLAQKFWPNGNPLGKRIGGADPAKRDWMEVVGVVNDVSFPFDSNTAAHLQIYRPMAQTGGNYFSVVLRTSVAPDSVADALHRAVARVDPDLAVYQVASIDHSLESIRRWNNLLANGILAMAISGLLVSTLGLYGVISQLVVERTAEIGIRVALGAQLRDIALLILGQGVRLAATGLVLGIAGAFALARLLASFMPGILGQDPLVVAASSALLVSVALLACWIPARRAARVDPAETLRAE